MNIILKMLDENRRALLLKQVMKIWALLTHAEFV
jgi:hypothetical protein